MFDRHAGRVRHRDALAAGVGDAIEAGVSEKSVRRAGGPVRHFAADDVVDRLAIGSWLRPAADFGADLRVGEVPRARTRGIQLLCDRLRLIRRERLFHIEQVEALRYVNWADVRSSDRWRKGGAQNLLLLLQ